MLKRLKGDWLTQAIGNAVFFFEVDADEASDSIFDRSAQETLPTKIFDFEEIYGPSGRAHGIDADIDWTTVQNDPECEKLLRRSSEIRDDFERILNQKDKTNREIFNELKTALDSAQKEFEEALREKEPTRESHL